MTGGEKVLALIPARGGSKGLPQKNILPLGGHPLIAWSIAAARATPGIDRVVVTTDSPEIARIAREYGAETPFLRPADLAGDFTTDLETFVHALRWLEAEESYRPGQVFQLRPTSPIRFRTEMETCLRLLRDHPEAQSVRTLTPSPVTPYKMWFMEGPEQPLRPLLTVPGMAEPYNMPRQKLPVTWWQTGTYDLIRTRVILEENSMSGSCILPLCIENHLAVDIDDRASFDRAEALIASLDCIRP